MSAFEMSLASITIDNEDSSVKEDEQLPASFPQRDAFPSSFGANNISAPSQVQGQQQHLPICGTNAVPFGTINLSTLKIPIMNIALSNNSVFTSPQTSSTGVGSVHKINIGSPYCPRSSDDGLNAIGFPSMVEEHNSDILIHHVDVDPDVGDTTTPGEMGHASQLFHYNHDSEYPCNMQHLSKEAVVAKHDINDDDNKISLIHCTLDSLDSGVDKAVIVVDGSDGCDNPHQNYTNSIFEGDSNSNMTENNYTSQFSSFENLGLEGMVKRASIPIDSSDLKCLNTNKISLDCISNDKITASEGGAPIYPNFLCLMCGQSEIVCIQQDVNAAVVGKMKKKVLPILTGELKCDSKDIAQRGGKICLYCLKKVQDMEALRDALQEKQKLLTNLYNSNTNLFNELAKEDECELDMDANTLEKYYRKKSFILSLPFEDSYYNDPDYVENHRKGRQFRCFKCHLGFNVSSVRDKHSRTCKLGAFLVKSNSSKESFKRFPQCRDNAEDFKKLFKEKRKLYKGFQCDKCKEYFPSRQRLITHTASHESSFDCSFCGRFLTSKVRLATHMYKFHGVGEGKKKDIQCELCNKTFQTKPGLSYHQNVAHQTDTKFTCPHCSKVYFHLGPFKSHVLFAHGEKKVVCETCGEMFFTVSKLNTHINAVHRNAQTWHCSDCNVKFTTGTAYRQHNLVKHHNTKFPCHFCSIQFRKKSSLYTHLREHSIFKCRLCKEEFMDEELYSTHMIDKHSEVITKQVKRKNLCNYVTQNPSKKVKLRPEARRAFALNNKNVMKSYTEQSQSFNRINLNEILLTNSYSNSNSLQVFSSTSDKPTNFDVNDSGGKMQSFSLLNSSALEIRDTNSLAIAEDDGDISFINVGILNNIEIGEAAAVVPDPPTPLHGKGDQRHSQNLVLPIVAGQLEASLPSTPFTAADAQGIDANNDVVVGTDNENLLKQAVHSLVSSVRDLSVVDHQHLGSFPPQSDADDQRQSSVTVLGSSTSVMSDGRNVIGLSSHQQAVGALSIDPSTVHLEAPVVQVDDPSHIWMKEGCSWVAIDAGGASDAVEGLHHLQGIVVPSPPSIVDVLDDIAVIGSGIVGTGVIGDAGTIDLGITDKIDSQDLDDLSATISG